MSDDKYRVVNSRPADSVFGLLVNAVSDGPKIITVIDTSTGEISDVGTRPGQSVHDAIANGQSIKK
ncbi:MAG: hypothetical protein PHN74_00925 [Candidatus Pacebacteria bacterium]|nr:hypothetical protein [Candidatus Paceibacterota bacterium]